AFPWKGRAVSFSLAWPTHPVVGKRPPIPAPLVNCSLYSSINSRLCSTSFRTLLVLSIGNEFTTCCTSRPKIRVLLLKELVNKESTCFYSSDWTPKESKCFYSKDRSSKNPPVSIQRIGRQRIRLFLFKGSVAKESTYFYSKGWSPKNVTSTQGDQRAKEEVVSALKAGTFLLIKWDSP
ncbi:MAG: hypothetical protein K0R57_2385, partial [Paenibacillaceae bacterium]|nr:hypothetical protein [Paenibacillaceae bacterium]